MFASLSILALYGVGLLRWYHATEGMLIILYCERRLVQTGWSWVGVYFQGKATHSTAFDAYMSGLTCNIIHYYHYYFQPLTPYH